MQILIFLFMNIELTLYDDWSIKKKELTRVDREVLFKEGEIWWCSLGLNIGTETYGKGPEFKRPVLIFKRLSSQNCLILPITSKAKNGSWFIEVDCLGEKRWVMLHQIRMINLKRLKSRIAVASGFDFLKIKKEFEQLLKL